MAFTPVLALGLVSQSIFVGGNVAISSLFIPIIRNSQLQPSSQVKLWSKMFTGATKIMVPSAIISSICYFYQAYYSVDRESRLPMLITGAISLSVLFYTRIFMFPNIRQLQGYELLADEELESKNFGSSIDLWNKLSIIRVLIFSIGFASGLWSQISKL